MECPVCYVEYDTGAFKPKVNFCGHTICSACIKRIRECCICKKPINHERSEPRSYLPNISRSSRVDFFPSHYLRNSLGSGEQEGISEPKDNFALIEVLEKHLEEKKQREQSLSQANFWCVDCPAILTKLEMDRQHMLHKGHNLRYVDPDIFKLYYDIEDLSRNISATINDHEVNLIQLTRISEEQQRMTTSIPERIAEAFDEFISQVLKAKQDMQDLFLSELKKKQQQTEELVSESSTLCKILDDMKKNLGEIKDRLIDKNFDVEEQVEKQCLESQSSNLGDLISKRYSSEHIEKNCKVANPICALKKLFKLTLQQIPKAPVQPQPQQEDLNLTFDPIENSLASFSKNVNQVLSTRDDTSNRQTLQTQHFTSTQTNRPSSNSALQNYMSEQTYNRMGNLNDTFEELNNRRGTNPDNTSLEASSVSHREDQELTSSFSVDELESERINGINASDRSLEFRRRDDSIDLDYMDTMYHAYGDDEIHYPRNSNFPPY